MNCTLERKHGSTVVIGMVVLLIMIVLAGIVAGSSLANQTSSTTTMAVIKAPDKMPECTQKQFRYVVKKVYFKRIVTKRDHEKIFKARICLNHQSKAKDFQRRQGQLRKQRLDPWAYAWSKIDAGLKNTLARVRHCESTNNYRIVNSSGHGGAYQYDRSTWQEAGGSGYAQNASPREQDVRTAFFFPSHQSRWKASRYCWG